MSKVTDNTKETYISSVKALIDSAYKKWDEVVFENPTNIGKEELVEHLVKSYGRTLFISQSYDINRQWNAHPDIVENVVFMTYTMFSSINSAEVHDFCRPYSLIILDEAHHAGAKGYHQNVSIVLNAAGESYKVFGMTTHTKRYSDNAEDVAYTIFNGHKIDGISFENAIKEGLLPQFDYVSALYSLPKDIDDLISSSSLARRIISDNKLIQVNEEGIKEIVRKHMPDGDRKVVYFVPTIEDSEDAEKLANELGYGKVYSINYTKGDKQNRQALKEYNEAVCASLVCISKFNEGAIPQGTNTVVILRRTATISIFERQVLTAIASATGRSVVYDFVSNIDNLIYSRKKGEEQSKSYYAERVKSLCSQSIVVDYARQWTSVFNKLRSISQTGWTPLQDEQLKNLYPKYGNDIYKYIKGHNLKDCILRAEVLGIEYIPLEKKKPEKKIIVRPYSLPVDEIRRDTELNKVLSQKSIKSLCHAYMVTLDTGRIPNGFTRILETEDSDRISSVMVLYNICEDRTKIIDPDKTEEIKKSQNIFRSYVESYISSHDKEASNIVILDGKAMTKGVTKEVLDRHIAEKKFKKKKDKMTLVEDRYMNNNTAVAGKLGDTILEHTLYRVYFGLLMKDVKPNKVNSNIAQFMKEYSVDDIVAKIEAIRSSENPWSKDEINFIKTAGNNPIALYKTLIINHSDLDILIKAKEIGNEGFTEFSNKRTRTFENGFSEFLGLYSEAVQKAASKKERALEQQRMEEENKRKKAARAERLKNIKPTVMVISKKK